MGDTLVLCYHALSPSWPAALSVTPDAFAAQLEHLRRRGYRPVTFTQGIADLAGNQVAITFDDAFASVVTRAKPLLDAIGWPATVFAVSGFADSARRLSWDGTSQWEGTSHAGELTGLEWNHLRALADAGWEVGSHTVSHPRLTRLGDAELRRELTESRQAIELALERPCHAVAYPYGDVDRRVSSAAREAGYAAGAGLPVHWPGPRPLDWPRVGIYYPDTLRRFKIKASPTVRRTRALLRR